MGLAVECNGLVKDFGEVRALDGLSFQVKNGEIYGLIGPNGAGKTTALRIVSTLLLPTSGSVKVFGQDVINDASEIRRVISYFLKGLELTKTFLVMSTYSLWQSLPQKTKK